VIVNVACHDNVIDISPQTVASYFDPETLAVQGRCASGTATICVQAADLNATIAILSGIGMDSISRYTDRALWMTECASISCKIVSDIVVSTLWARL
jgi:sugar/nucleoside kinase (ribokinase family)